MSDLQRPEWFKLERPDIGIVMRWYGHDYHCHFDTTRLVYYDEPYSAMNHIVHFDTDNNYLTFVYDVPEDMDMLKVMHFDSETPGIPDDDTIEFWIQWENWKMAEHYGEQWESGVEE